MHLLVQCEDCKQIINIGKLDRLPQTSRLISELADLYHGHSCIQLDKVKIAN